VFCSWPVTMLPLTANFSALSFAVGLWVCHYLSLSMMGVLLLSMHTGRHF
jgi:hypothetical protein